LSGEVNKEFLIIVGRGFIASEFMTLKALVEEDVFTGFDLKADRLH